MNLPNKLTLFRLILVPIFMVFTIVDNVWTRVFALIIFLMAAATDFYDGYFARKYGVVTDLGKFMDPVADKLLISAAFISFVGLKELNVPAWMVILIIGREFLVTGLRTVAASKGVVIAADASGKYKTSLQIASIVTMLIILCINSALTHLHKGQTPEQVIEQSIGEPLFTSFLQWSSYWLVFGTMIFTLVTGISYLYKNRSILSDSPR